MFPYSTDVNEDNKDEITDWALPQIELRVLDFAAANASATQVAVLELSRKLLSEAHTGCRQITSRKPQPTRLLITRNST